MYAVTSIPLVSRTRATLRRAEFGFFGVVVYTRVQTPRRWGAATRRLRPRPDFRPGVATFFFGALRPLRTSWEVVGMRRTMLATKMPGPMEPEPIFRAAEAGVYVPTGHAPGRGGPQAVRPPGGARVVGAPRPRRGPWDPDALHGGAPAALLMRAVGALG